MMYSSGIPLGETADIALGGTATELEDGIAELSHNYGAQDHATAEKSLLIRQGGGDKNKTLGAVEDILPIPAVGLATAIIEHVGKLTAPATVTGAGAGTFDDMRRLPVDVQEGTGSAAQRTHMPAVLLCPG